MKLFWERQKLETTTKEYKLYSIDYKGKPCGKLTFNYINPILYLPFVGIEFSNLLPVYKITEHSIITKKIALFSDVYDKKHIMYNKYVAVKLFKAVKYMHEVLGKTHNDIKMESLFVDVFGNILLGNLSKSTSIISTGEEANSSMARNNDGHPNSNVFDISIGYTCKEMENDIEAINGLSKKWTGKNVNDIEDQEIEIYLSLESEKDFENFEDTEKKEIIGKIIENRKELVDPVKDIIFRLITREIKRKSEDNSFKLYCMESLVAIDKNMVLKNPEMFFSILNTPIRMYLLDIMDNDCQLERSIDYICLGLRVRDRVLKRQTIGFLFRNESRFHASFDKILQYIANDVVEKEHIELVCSYLLERRPDENSKYIYLLSIMYLHKNPGLKIVYRLIEYYLPFFNKYKIATELLPFLCSKLTKKELQDDCFILMEKTITILKQNKEEIRKKKWSLKGIRRALKLDIFGNNSSIPAVVLSDDISFPEADSDENRHDWDEF